MLRALADLLIPPACGICARPVARGDAVCRSCAGEIARSGPVVSRIAGMEVVSAARYEGAARRLVAAAKFRARLGLLELAAARMAAAWTRPEEAIVTPVPGAPARVRARGFDAADILAARVADLAGTPMARILERGDGPRQFGRPRRERLADPPRIRALGPMPAGPIWVVDDVATTGATLLACAVAIGTAGGLPAGALTFARADHFAPRSAEA